MSDPIGAAALRNLQGIGGIQDGPRSISVDIGKGDGPSFGDTLKRALGEVSNAQDNATDQMQRFMRGEPVELHQVMAAAEESGIALEMLVELRNKFTEAYRTLVNMQS
jgi:flagellar hook-basal body complex protein FliE